jgi:hypothetical protein
VVIALFYSNELCSAGHKNQNSISNLEQEHFRDEKGRIIDAVQNAGHQLYRTFTF